MKLPAVLTAALVASLPFPLSAEERRGDNPDAKPLTPQEQLKRFKVPPGFEVQLVASEPEIQKPVNINFDAAGRLWMTGSEMYPWPAATDAAGKPLPNFQKAYEDIANAFGSKGKAPAVLAEGRDTVRILSDFGPDGRARKIDIFADKLNIPTGIQPLPRKPGAKGDSAIVYSIPNIWRFEDTDGDGKADKREPLYEGFGYLDTHGMSSNYIYWIDGWIYGCHGFRNHSEVKDRNGNVTVFDSGNTYRFRPDGSKIEYWSYGQTNPFGLAFDPLGNLYSADSHSKPVYLLLKGGHYEGIGKNHDGLGFAPRITDDDHGSSAIAGVMYYADDKWPKEFHGNLFNGNPVTNRINRATLEWHGSTPKATRVADFVTCDDPWFRPVQTKLGPDGALYIADFYNPIIGHYEVPLSDPRRDRTHGRIWRVVWRGEKGNQAVAQAPDLSGMDAKGLVEKLGDANLEMRRLATNEVVERRDEQLTDMLRKGLATGTVSSRAHALRALERMNSLDESEISKLLNDPQEGVRLHMTRAVTEKAEWSDELTKEVHYRAFDDSAAVRRTAADALARHPAGIHLDVLVKALQEAPKELELTYALRIALREQLRIPGIHSLATSLSQGDDYYAKALADASLAVPTQSSAAFLLSLLDRGALEPSRLEEDVRHIAQHIAPDRLGALVKALGADTADATRTQQKAKLNASARVALADALNEAARKRGLTLSESVTTWMQRTMIDALASTDPALLDRAIAAARDAKLDEKYEPLRRIVADTKGHGPRRAAALEALMNHKRSTEVLVSSLNDPSSMTLRKRAAELLGESSSSEASDALQAVLVNAPTELASTIANSLAKTDEGLQALLTGIQSGRVSPRVLLSRTVAGAIEKRPEGLRQLAVTLTQNLPPEDTRLDQLIAQRVTDFRGAQPDTGRGQLLFQQQCAACHKLKNNGGNIGPNLDGVASRGVHRLLEDILDPNRNVDPAFRQTMIETIDGRTLAGVNLRTEGELVLLSDAAGKEVSVQKTQVKSQTQSHLSLMPGAFEHTLNSKDLSDLVGYLLAQ